MADCSMGHSSRSWRSARGSRSYACMRAASASPTSSTPSVLEWLLANEVELQPRALQDLVPGRQTTTILGSHLLRHAVRLDGRLALGDDLVRRRVLLVDLGYLLQDVKDVALLDLDDPRPVGDVDRLG